MDTETPRDEPVRLGSQTLFRGLDVLDVVADGPISLSELAERLELTRSTTHRLATALADRRYLTFVPRTGYTLGPKLLELGYRVREELDIPRVAAPFIEELAASTGDTVHLGVLEGGRVMYLDKIPGRRRISIRSRIGEQQPVSSTGLGKALLLDDDETSWRRYFISERVHHRAELTLDEWMGRMRAYSQCGYAFDLEENEDRIRCVAAPIRAVDGAIVAAISVASAAQYMSDERMAELCQEVTETSRLISQRLGWSGERRTEPSKGPASAAPKRGRGPAKVKEPV